MKRTCHIDFETRSPLGIKSHGAYRQMEDPRTEPLCLAFHLSDSPRYAIWVPRASEFGEPFVNALAERYETYIYTNIPRPLHEALLDPDCTFVSHNIEFEIAVWNMICAKRYGWPELPLTRIDCTMARCGACNLPLGLDEAAVALGLGITKDKEGRAIMLKMSGVRKLSSGAAWVWTPHDLRKLIDYCVQDIKVEERIDAALAPLSTIQREVFRTNLEINIRGFFTDEDLIVQAFRFADLTCKRLGSLAEFRTNGKFNEAKLRSPGALVKTLAEEYFFDLPNAEADTIEALAKNPDLDEEIRFVLACRAQIAKTSVSKFKKFLDMRSEIDGRVRGCYFYHAAGTGRFGGRGVQTQNLYKPRKWVVKEDGTKKSLWPEFVSLIRSGDFDGFWTLLSGLPKTTVPKGMSALADCIRPVIRAHPDYTLVAADWSAIEARGVQWLAGDEKGLALFRDFDVHERWEDDPYVKMIAYVQGVPPEKITDSERAIGKTITLGCFGGNTPVLTSCGWKRLDTITEHDWLWDGGEWVKSLGAIFQGEKNVIDMHGVLSTPDHQILTESGWKDASLVADESTGFLLSAKSLANLPYPGSYGEFEGEYFPSWFRAVADALVNTLLTPTTCNMGELRDVTPAPNLLLRSTNCGDVDSAKLSLTKKNETDCSAESAAYSKDAIAPTAMRSSIMGPEESRYRTNSKTKSDSPNISSVSKDGIVQDSQSTGSTTTVIMKGEICASSPPESTISIKDQEGLRVKTYDILNSGPRHRFTILTKEGPIICSNCGFAMGKDRFFATAAEWGTPVSMEMAERCVIAFRELHEPVKKLWYNTNAAAIKAVQEPGTIQKVKGSEMTMYKSDGATLKCRLPSGRLLWYWSPVVKIEPTPWGKMSPHLYYKGVDGFTHKWTEFGIHGGVLVENNTQGICADLLMEALLRLAKTKYKVIHHVHDEIVAEIHAAKATDVDLFQFENLMQVVPAWAKGFPLKAKGWMGDHYRK